MTNDLTFWQFILTIGFIVSGCTMLAVGIVMLVR